MRASRPSRTEERGHSRVRLLSTLLLLALAACTVNEHSHELASNIQAAISPPQNARRFGSGTGFFIASDGTLMTARHVVEDCLRIDVLSETIAPVSASVIVTSRNWDLALLRPTGTLSAPAVPLAIAVTPARLAADLKAYGYPNTDARRAVAAELKLVNDRVPADAVTEPLRKSGYVLWVDGPLGHGYSGGPILDQEGDVVGLIRGSHETLRHFVATGTWPLIDLIANTEVKPRFTHEPDDADPDMRARRGIVRVVCWRAPAEQRVS